jgi:hypothetical protein
MELKLFENFKAAVDDDDNPQTSQEAFCGTNSILT